MYSIQTLTPEFKPSGVRLAQSLDRDEIIDLWRPGATVLCWTDERPAKPIRRWSAEAIARNRRKRALARFERQVPLFAAQLIEAYDASRAQELRSWAQSAGDSLNHKDQSS